MALARRVEEELLILQPEQLTIPLPKTKENIIILPRKHEIAVPLFNMSLLRYVCTLAAILMISGFVISARASYLYSVSQGMETIQKEMTVLRNQNDILKIHIAEASSLEKIENRAITLGFAKPSQTQIYEMPVIRQVLN